MFFNFFFPQRSYSSRGWSQPVGNCAKVWALRDQDASGKGKQFEPKPEQYDLTVWSSTCIIIQVIWARTSVKIQNDYDLNPNLIVHKNWFERKPERQYKIVWTQTCTIWLNILKPNQDNNKKGNLNTNLHDNSSGLNASINYNTRQVEPKHEKYC